MNDSLPSGALIAMPIVSIGSCTRARTFVRPVFSSIYGVGAWWLIVREAGAIVFMGLRSCRGWEMCA